MRGLSAVLALTAWLCLAPARSAPAGQPPLPAGPFEPNWPSLERHAVPEWYLDAKFGIFIHWGVYSVPAFGSEWYPRKMYQPGSPEFNHHLETYGPQSKFGYKDFIPRFKGERYDPTHWAKLFKAAGAKFVVPVAEHHDGFAMYDSALTSWCAAKMGPKRDVLGELARALRKQGLVFGLSSHRAEHWWFYDGGRKFDSDVRDPRYAGLYGPARDQKASEAQITPPDAAFLEDWLARCCELVDKYHPQLVWFDWWIGQPAFKPYLQKFAAYYYDRGFAWRRGVAINYKNNAFPSRAAVLDIERGQLTRIRPLFWQTDTAIAKNSWGYVEHQDYKSTGEIIDDLVDIVSKNGALLLNIGPKSDGTIPEPEESVLREIGRWLAVNGEGIYRTRPWVVYGEGPTQVVGGSFNDTKREPFTGQDLRFTTRSNTLYAITLAWPGRQVTIGSLGSTSPLVEGNVRSIHLLGHKGKLKWSRSPTGLSVDLPEQRPCDYAVTLKITGLKLDRLTRQLANTTVVLTADLAELHGTKITTEQGGDSDAIGSWDNPREWVSWTARLPQRGFYQISAAASAANGPTDFVVEVAGLQMLGRVPQTPTWNDFQTVPVGAIQVPTATELRVAVHAREVATWRGLGLSFVKFERLR
ncbi:MAG: alpha-L-fucosidase [Verrucomicrobia bacterium]|nr:alpha-L-fucosidase [Verrucomicrobiota bacterium]